MGVAGGGSYTFAGNRGDDQYSMNGNAVMSAYYMLFALNNLGVPNIASMVQVHWAMSRFGYLRLLLFSLVSTGAVAAPLVSRESRISRGGHYQVVLRPEAEPVPIGKIHRWHLQLQPLVKGTPLPPPPLSAEVRRRLPPLQLRGVTVDGAMPSHGHGLPTKPVLTADSEPGSYKVDGISFNMGGTWILRVLIADANGFDMAEFPLEIGADPSAVPSLSSSFSAEEKQTLRSLSLAALGPPPTDASNRVADDPRAARFGHKLFFDRQLSRSGQVACSSCHDPRRAFSDGLRVGHGSVDLKRNTPSLVGLAYANWLLWDGRRDSLWSQALIPLEAPIEMGQTRLGVVRYVLSQPTYRQHYVALFGAPPALPQTGPFAASPTGDPEERAAWATLSPVQQHQVNRAFANIGKVLAAYERQLRPGSAPFDRYVKALLGPRPAAADRHLSPAAIAGLKMFISAEAQCLRCHNGPLLTNGGFHQIATFSGPRDLPDFGRSVGIMALLATEFNCLGPYSDDKQHRCPNLAALDRSDENTRLNAAYKVPSLRNVADTAPYMHDGRFKTLKEVMEHYRQPKYTTATTEFRPIFDMSPAREDAIIAFLQALSAPIEAPAEYLLPPGEIGRRTSATH